MASQADTNDANFTKNDVETSETPQPSIIQLDNLNNEMQTLQNIPLTNSENDTGFSLENGTSRNTDESKVDLYDPSEAGAERSEENNLDILASLKTSAVELFVEFYGMTRIELFGRTHCFTVLFSEGTAPGSWDIADQSNLMPCEYHMRSFQRFRLRAATEVDRAETYLLALFASETIPVDRKLLTAENAWAFAEFTVRQILESDQMILEKRLKYGKSGVLAKGSVSLALDVIYHVEHDRKVALEFGFLTGSPRRNRMYFEICKALRRGKWTPLYKSEIRNHDEVNKFETASVDGQDLHGGDMSKLIRLELFRWYKNGRVKLLGFIQTNFEKLSNLKTNDQLYWWPAEEGISCAKVIVQDVMSTDKQLFLALRMANMF